MLTGRAPPTLEIDLDFAKSQYWRDGNERKVDFCILSGRQVTGELVDGSALVGTWCVLVVPGTSAKLFCAKTEAANSDRLIWLMWTCRLAATLTRSRRESDQRSIVDHEDIHDTVRHTTMQHGSTIEPASLLINQPLTTKMQSSSD